MLERFPLFGVAGFPPNFKKHKLRVKRENIFEWLNELGLNWIELQNTYGIKMKSEQALLYREKSEKFNIGISLHAPYFITLASKDREVVKRSQERIMQSYRLAEIIGAKRIIFHPGHFPGDSEDDRARGLKQLIEKLNEIKDDLPINDIKIYPEIAGKINQLGSLEDIINICEKVIFAYPCLDLAHFHAREGGVLINAEDIMKVFETIENKLGRTVLEKCHFHMYPIDFNHLGEKCHKSFTDSKKNVQLSLFESNDNINIFYPRAKPFIDAIKAYKLAPVVICEARDTQDEGALRMKDYYYNQ